MPGDGFEEAPQVAKEFSCGHTELLRGYLTLLKRHNVGKMLLGLELSDGIDLSVSKLWQCVSSHTLWSLNVCCYFVWHSGFFMPWPVASMAQYSDPVVFARWHMFVLIWVHKVCTLEVDFEVSSSVKRQVLPGFWVETSSLMIILSPSADYRGKGHWKLNPKAWFLLRTIKYSTGPFLAIICSNQISNSTFYWYTQVYQWHSALIETIAVLQVSAVFQFLLPTWHCLVLHRGGTFWL